MDLPQLTKEHGAIKKRVTPGDSGLNVKVGLSSNKVMVAIFRNTRGNVHIDYGEIGGTLNDQSYVNSFKSFNENLEKKH